MIHRWQQQRLLNHVLAQIYQNTTVREVPKKACIPAHSDKTKDMPMEDELIAFCTLYKDYLNGTFEDSKLKQVNPP